MDSYNHHMMDTDYGHNVYGPPITNQMHTNLQPEGILLQGGTDAVKDVQYMAPRESIITSNVTGHQLMDQYQQPAPIGDDQQSTVQVNNGKIETEPSAEYENQDAEQTKQEEPLDQINESTDLVNTEEPDTKPAVAAQEQETPTNEDESIKTTSLEIEPIVDDAEASTSGSKVADGEVDQNQCRVCMSKVNLVNIFTYENNVRICDNIMTICTSVKILERDFLPHYVCTICLDKIKIAIEFKSTCESTDKELRSKLKRSKSKVVRRRRDFILVDCELSSEASDNNAKDDDEFKISEDEVVAEDSEPDSDVSFPPAKRKRGRPKKKLLKKKETKAAKKSLQKSATKTPRSTRNSSGRSEVSSSTKSFRHDVVFVEAPHLTEEDESEDDKPLKRRRGRKPKAETIAAAAAAAGKAKGSVSKSTPTSTNKNSKIPHKKRAIQPQTDNEDDDDVSEVTSPSNSAKKEHICQYCEKTFPTSTLLKEHKKTHVGEKPLSCNICQKGFKQRVSLDSHIQKHKDDDSRTCKPCDKQFASRMELRKHQQTVHEDEYTFECEKCKRSFTTKTRLEKHKESKCPGFDTTVPRKKTEVEVTSNLGRDLFKCVAPLTTTYWSDSYSE